MSAAPKVLIVGDFPPPYGGVAVHVEVLRLAVRSRGGECTVLDIGKGQLPADGVVPAAGYASFTARLGAFALRGYRIHVHTSGANPKSWALAAICAAAGKLARVPPLITFHSGLAPGWLAADPVRARIAGAVCNAFGTVIVVSEILREALLTCGVAPRRLEVVPAFSHSFVQPGAPPPGFRELREQAAPLYCAMLAPGPVYGAEVLLRAFAEVHQHNPRARLALYGPSTLEMDLSYAGAGAGAVRAYGELHRSAALALIAASDVFVRPTLADGDSVSVREAVALGRVVVATSVGARPPQVRLAPPGDAAALARALLEAAGTTPVLQLARAADEPDDDCVDRLLELYGFDSGAEPVEKARRSTSPSPVEGPACAASAAS